MAQFVLVDPVVLCGKLDAVNNYIRGLVPPHESPPAPEPPPEPVATAQPTPPPTPPPTPEPVLDIEARVMLVITMALVYRLTQSKRKLIGDELVERTQLEVALRCGLNVSDVNVVLIRREIARLATAKEIVWDEGWCLPYRRQLNPAPCYVATPTASLPATEEVVKYPFLTRGQNADGYTLRQVINLALCDARRALTFHQLFCRVRQSYVSSGNLKGCMSSALSNMRRKDEIERTSSGRWRIAKGECV